MKAFSNVERPDRLLVSLELNELLWACHLVQQLHPCHLLCRTSLQAERVETDGKRATDECMHKGKRLRRRLSPRFRRTECSVDIVDGRDGADVTESLSEIAERFASFRDFLAQ